MAAHAYILMRRLRATVTRHDGKVTPDGCGGYDVIAPEGCRWKAAEVSCQPVPLGEADSWGEKEEMIRSALSAVAGGVEKIRP